MKRLVVPRAPLIVVLMLAASSACAEQKFQNVYA